MTFQILSELVLYGIINDLPYTTLTNKSIFEYSFHTAEN